MNLRFFARLRRDASGSGPTRTEIRENFKIKVPKDKATTVQHALEGWLQSQGWPAVVNASATGDYVEFSFQHQQDSPGATRKLDAGKMAAELQQVLEDALKQQQA